MHKECAQTVTSCPSPAILSISLWSIRLQWSILRKHNILCSPSSPSHADGHTQTSPSCLIWMLAKLPCHHFYSFQFSQPDSSWKKFCSCAILALKPARFPRAPAFLLALNEARNLFVLPRFFSQSSEVSYSKISLLNTTFQPLPNL